MESYFFYVYLGGAYVHFIQQFTSLSAFKWKNVFRKDEVKVFEDNEALLQNAPEQENNMFKIPKVL